MTIATISRPAQSFVPPGDRAVRLSHLDPRPLYAEHAPVELPWRSPSFYLAYVLVMTFAAFVAPVRYLLGR